MVKLLIVDDDMVTRFFLRNLVDRHPEIEVVGEAESGEEAVRMARELVPDVITMDVMMPGMDGLEATRRIMAGSHRPPIIMVSDVTQADSEATLKALELGAVDFLSKSASGPQEDLSGADAVLANMEAAFGHRLDMPHVNKALVNKVMHWARHRVDGALPSFQPPVATRSEGVKLVIIGVSSGGVQALPALLGAMGRLAVPVILLQDLPFVESFVSMVRQRTVMEVVAAAPGMTMRPGVIQVVPGGVEVLVRRDAGGQVVFAAGTSSVSPAVPVLFSSMAEILGHGALVLLAGSGERMIRGAEFLAGKGWPVLVQDPATGSVNQAVQVGLPAGTKALALAPEAMGKRLAQWVG